MSVLLFAFGLVPQGQEGEGNGPRAPDGSQACPQVREDDSSSNGPADVGAPAETPPPGEIETARPREHRSAFGFELSGGATLATRMLDVGGNRSQFDEDLNLDEGLFLRDLELDGRKIEGGSGPESFSFRAAGLGTREEVVRAETSYRGTDVLARYGHTLYSGTTDSDIHSFDFERENGALSLEREGRGGTLRRAGVELSFGRRDGITIGSMSAGSRAVSGVPRELDERRLGGEGQVGLSLGRLELDLQVGMEGLDTSEQHSFQSPHPIFPQSTITEEFSGDTEGLARRATARLSRKEIAEDLDLDMGATWRGVESDGSSDHHETGIFGSPDSPFVSDTLGDMDFEGNSVTLDAGILWQITGEAALEVRFTHEVEREDGSLLRTVTLDELSGDPPTTSLFLDELERRSRLELIETSLSTPIGSRFDLDLSLEAGLEEIDVRDVSDQVVVRRFDDAVDLFGGQGTLSMETGPKSTLELSGGFGIVPTESSEVGVQFTFEDTRTSFGSLGWRWHPTESETMAAQARHEERRSEAFHSEGQSDSLSCSTSTLIGGTVSLEGAFTYRAFDLEADTTFLILNPAATEVPGSVSFEGSQRIWTAGVSWEALPTLHPLLFANLTAGDGDSSYGYDNLGIDVPWRLATSLELGASLSWFRFDGDGQLDGRDYDAAVLTIYARATF